VEYAIFRQKKTIKKLGSMLSPVHPHSKNSSHAYVKRVPVIHWL